MQFQPKKHFWRFFMSHVSFKIILCISQKKKKNVNLSKKKIDEKKKNALRSQQTSNKDKQTGTAALSLSAHMFYLTPICSLSAPIWFFFLSVLLGMGVEAGMSTHLLCFYKSILEQYTGKSS